jgi:hypothetical protein
MTITKQQQDTEAGPAAGAGAAAETSSSNYDDGSRFVMLGYICKDARGRKGGAAYGGRGGVERRTEEGEGWSL